MIVSGGDFDKGIADLYRTVLKPTAVFRLHVFQAPTRARQWGRSRTGDSDAVTR